MTIMHAVQPAKSAAFLAAALLLAPLPAIAQTAAPAAITATAPWARAAVGRTGAAYVTVTGTAADRLVAAATPVAEAAELHAHMHDNGVMRMRPVTDVEVKPGTPLVFAPGGLHIMLVGLKGPLRQGDHFPLTLTFAGAGPMTIEVPVLAAGASGP